MSRRDRNTLLPEWIQKQLAEYRRRAAEPGKWPQTANHLLALITQPAQPPGSDERDHDMLSLVVNDARAGIDIAQRYPAFYEKMVATPRLYRAFLDALETLEADSNDALTPLPQPASHDLSFLKRNMVQLPKIDQSEQGGWRITWQLLADQLRRSLFPSPEPAYRRATSLLEDESFILLHDELELSGQLLEVILEAVRPVERPEILRLQVLVASASDRPPAMQASLNWGRYAEAAVLDRYGRAQFPPLPLDDILNESGHLKVDDLQLVLIRQQDGIDT